MDTSKFLPGIAAKLPAIRARDQYIRERLIPGRWFLQCQLRLLIVTDASGSFDATQSFGLGHFLKVFTYDPANSVIDNPASYVNFTVKTAHRGSAPADFSNFKFDAHDLSQYDQVWLFGVARGGDQLSEKEMKAIYQFMNNGGGIFATGDHEDLGVDLCGSLPRVRCMRRWWFFNADPLGSPPAPPISGSNHNTIDDNPATPTNERTIFGFQSDDYPQHITPRLRRVPTDIYFRKRVFPHPLLCGPNGAIRVLPDHMHEGRCDIYPDFGRSFTFDGYTEVEFPNRLFSTRIQRPEVIADNTNQLTGNKFESISVYDGHRTPTNGRIVCDATWHHFFNINLVGFEEARADVRNGTATADQVRAENDYVNIRAYFRNIAYWISRKSDQDCMRRKGLHLVVHDFDFKIAYRPLKLVSDKIAYYLYWGELAKDSLNQLAPQCQWYEWIGWLVNELVLYRKVLPRPFDELDEEVGELPKWIDVDRLQTILLGQAAHQLFEFTQAQKSFSDKSYAKMDSVLLSGRDELLAQVISEWNQDLKLLQQDLQPLKRKTDLK